MYLRCGTRQRHWLREGCPGPWGLRRARPCCGETSANRSVPPLPGPLRLCAPLSPCWSGGGPRCTRAWYPPQRSWSLSETPPQSSQVLPLLGAAKPHQAAVGRGLPLPSTCTSCPPQGLRPRVARGKTEAWEISRAEGTSFRRAYQGGGAEFAVRPLSAPGSPAAEGVKRRPPRPSLYRGPGDLQRRGSRWRRQAGDPRPSGAPSPPGMLCPGGGLCLLPSEGPREQHVCG